MKIHKDDYCLACEMRKMFDASLKLADEMLLDEKKRAAYLYLGTPKKIKIKVNVTERLSGKWRDKNLQPGEIYLA